MVTLSLFAFLGIIAAAFGIGAAAGSAATVLIGESKLRQCCITYIAIYACSYSYIVKLCMHVAIGLANAIKTPCMGVN